MKARLLGTTGSFFSINPCWIEENERKYFYEVEDENGIKYSLDDIELELEESAEENTHIEAEPDYWEKLKHQYAGMMMQTLLADPTCACISYVSKAKAAIEYATALVEKLKGE